MAVWKWCIVIFIIALSANTSIQTAVDVARNKPIYANFTCGSFGPEIFDTSDNEKAAGAGLGQRGETCELNDPRFTPDKMVDGDVMTALQSTNRINLINLFRQAGQDAEGGKSEIYVDLEQVLNLIISHLSSHEVCPSIHF